MPAIYGDLAHLRALMMVAGVRRLVAKRLAENDNSKNQIYLGGGFEALNVLPFGDIYEDGSDKNQISEGTTELPLAAAGWNTYRRSACTADSVSTISGSPDVRISERREKRSQ